MRESYRVPPWQERPVFDDEITLPYRIVCERKDGSESESEDRSEEKRSEQDEDLSS
jgi:hypothetical protein